MWTKWPFLHCVGSLVAGPNSTYLLFKNLFWKKAMLHKFIFNKISFFPWTLVRITFLYELDDRLRSSSPAFSNHVFMVMLEQVWPLRSITCNIIACFKPCGDDFGTNRIWEWRPGAWLRLSSAAAPQWSRHILGLKTTCIRILYFTGVCVHGQQKEHYFYTI